MARCGMNFKITNLGTGEEGSNMRLTILLAVCIAAVAANPQTVMPPARIVGGTVTTINQWPYMANIMVGSGNSFSQFCGGTIINNRSVLSAAHCVLTPNHSFPANWLRLRLGSTWASSGGVVHNVAQNILHPNYNMHTSNSDVMIFRSSTNFVYTNVLQQGTIASSNYNLPDNQAVWVTGWGHTSFNGVSSEQLRQVQVYTINQNICAQRYGGNTITANMLCTGVLNVGGRDACQGDSGGPVFHNRIVVGITSFGAGCADPFFPGVNARVSVFSQWIVANS